MGKKTEDGTVQMMLTSSELRGELRNNFETVGLSFELLVPETRKKKKIFDEEIEALSQEKQKDTERFQKEIYQQEMLLQEELHRINDNMEQAKVSKASVVKF